MNLSSSVLTCEIVASDSDGLDELRSEDRKREVGTHHFTLNGVSNVFFKLWPSSGLMGECETTLAAAAPALILHQRERERGEGKVFIAQARQNSPAPPYLGAKVTGYKQTR